MPELAELVKLLTDGERRTVTMLCFPGMHSIPRLLRLRYGARAAGLRNRECLGANCRRLEFAREQYKRGRMAEWNIRPTMPSGDARVKE
jgi:hypothetical protein